MDFIDLVLIVDLATHKQVLCRAPGWSALSGGDIVTYEATEVYEDGTSRCREGRVHAIVTVKDDKDDKEAAFIISMFSNAVTWPLKRVLSRWDKYDLSWPEDEINEQTEQTEETETEE